jgi:nitrite reductase/ring-hydroxylating ferredoxin subunit
MSLRELPEFLPQLGWSDSEKKLRSQMEKLILKNEERVKNLQAKCKHKKRTDYGFNSMDTGWYSHIVCDICGKEKQ